MKAIFFNVRPGTAPEALDALLEELRARPEISEAGVLRPGARNDALRRMHYATLEDGTDAGTLLRELNQRPEVESASLPAERHLAE